MNLNHQHLVGDFFNFNIMKKKKLIKYVTKQITKSLSLKYNGNVVKSRSEHDVDWSPYDEEVSTKFRTMIFSLIDCKSENVNVSIDYDSIGIRSDDYTEIKKPTKASYSDDNNLYISIYKDRGLSITLGYNLKSGYVDTTLYDDILDSVKNNISASYKSDFHNINDNVMKVFNRENNLKDLLDEC